MHAYEIIDLGTLADATFSRAYRINAAGQVVGLSGRAGHFYRAFIFQAGIMTDLGALPGGGNSGTLGINTAGEAVGFADTARGELHAVLFHNGKVQDLGGCRMGISVPPRRSTPPATSRACRKPAAAGSKPLSTRLAT